MKKFLLLSFLYLGLVSVSLAQAWQQLNDIGSNQRNITVPDFGGDVAKFSISGKTFLVCGQVSSALSNKVYQFDYTNKQWIKMNNFPDALGTPVAFVLNNIAYVGSGYSGTNKAINKKFWKYTEATDSWLSIADMPVARAGAVGFGLQNKGYVGLGTDSTGNHTRKEFFEYTPETNSWTAIADYAGEARSNAMAFTLNGLAYAGTGITSYPASKLFNDFWCYNPAQNTWKQIASYPGEARYHCMQFTLANIPYVGAGVTTNFFNAFNDFHYYVDSNDTWVPVTNFPFSLNYGVSFSNNVHAMVGRGTSGQTTNSKMYEYNPKANQWEFFRESHGVYGAASFAIDGKMYVVGGQTYDLGVNSDMWAYDMATKEWQKMADLPGQPRRYELKGFAIGGYGYVVAGSLNGVTPAADCWKYTPQTNTWSIMDSMPLPRNNPAVFVVNNKGYVCGGRMGANLLNDLWEYDPSLNQWLQKPSMPGIGREQAAAFSIDSNGYVVGGHGPANAVLSDFWSYNAYTNTWQRKADFFSEGTYLASATASSTDGYLMNGRDGKSTVYSTKVWKYDPKADLWSEYTSNPNLPIALGVSEYINGKLYLGLGSSLTAQFNSTFFEIDPSKPTGLQQAIGAEPRLAIESPFTHNPSLFYANLKPATYTISAYDAQGKLLSSSTEKIVKAEGQLELKGLENAAEGMLFIKVLGGNESKTIRVLKTD
ncbi:MAG: hypothetical protein CFE21_11255 [Bacteroidetes bacterium B1(2017)]|nr:MAG: hypothetical protein CFE21_11255 [Bacteroidetes bacterium B1(2017)]